MGRTIPNKALSGINVIANVLQRGAARFAQDGPDDRPEARPCQVLFVNGCDESLPTLTRYRVTHQREQLELRGVTTDEVFYLDLTLADESRAQTIVFYRCPITTMVHDVIILARGKEKAVFFDVDDLVIDTEYTDDFPAVKAMSHAEKEVFDSGVRRNGETLAMCDYAITTTAALADELLPYVDAVCINRNVASAEMVRLSQAAWENRRPNADGRVVMGYFSGSRTHNGDLQSIARPLADVLSSHPEAALLIVGECVLPDELAPYESQIMRHGYVDWHDLPALIRTTDIGLAPLEYTLFNAAKSENRWVEAALVGVPTVASNFGAFAEVVDDGVTGLLCSDEGAWADALSSLVEDGGLRDRIGEAARSWCLAHCTTETAGDEISEALAPIPHTISDVFAGNDAKANSSVAAFLEDRGISIVDFAYDPEPWSGVELSERIDRILESKRAGRRCAALLYDRAAGDDATFRYYGFNVAECLASSTEWDACYFFLDELDDLERMLDALDIVVLIRMRYHPRLQRFMERAHAAATPIAFFIDDDVVGIDKAERLAQVMAHDKDDQTEQDFWSGEAQRFAMVVQGCDFAIASTDYLARSLEQQLDVPVRTIGPFLNDMQVALSQSMSRAEQASNHAFAIGYFSGTSSHNADFELIKGQLLSFIDCHEDALLVLVGELKLDSELVQRWKDGSITLLPRVNYVTLQQLQAAVDVSLAPLVIDDFTSCKSGLKAFEAAAVGTPICASPSPSYSDVVKTLGQGAICAQPQDWAEALNRYYESPISPSDRASLEDRAVAAYHGQAVRSNIERVFDEVRAATIEPSTAMRDCAAHVRIDDWDDQFGASVALGRSARMGAAYGSEDQHESTLHRVARLTVAKVQREGFTSAADIVAENVRERINRFKWTSQNPDEATFFDVLFINGCDLSLPHPIRYRVDHQIQQLTACGVAVKCVNSWDLKKSDVTCARAFIIFRCPYTFEMGEFVALAKRLNKCVYFDIDDLVVDRRYTDTIEYVKTLSTAEYVAYSDGVDRMGRMLRECGRAITTTDRLAAELRTIVPEVFINRNTASDEMLFYSERAVRERDVLPYLEEGDIPPNERAHVRWARREAAKRDANSVVIGYFSGSITHNDDVAMILPVLVDVLGQRPQARLLVAGLLDIPRELEPYRDRISSFDFCPWERLPDVIAKADINIAPLEDTVFNAAKSENKWVEAAFVKVPTIASNIGAFAEMIENGKTGVLCDTPEEWKAALLRLIDDAAERKRIGEAAYAKCHADCFTLNTGQHLATYLKGQFNHNIFMVLPDLEISGGILVALKHCAILQGAGYDVTIVDSGAARQYCEPFVEVDDRLIPVVRAVSGRNKRLHELLMGSVDHMVATMWSTLDQLDRCPSVKKRQYLVQGFERDFYEPPLYQRMSANATYTRDDVDYLTISQWCKGWLENGFGRIVRYAPNGIDACKFPRKKRAFESGRKVRILVEGDPASYYKNVDEAFEITNALDPGRFEIWFMSYNAKPKSQYRVDRFLHSVPHDEVGDVYASCDILLKTSLLESFSYPPLEMMATGGFVVAIPNNGNAEYLVHGSNCLLFESGDRASAIASIELICESPELRERLERNGLETAQSRDWAVLERQVLALYAD